MSHEIDYKQKRMKGSHHSTSFRDDVVGQRMTSFTQSSTSNSDVNCVSSLTYTSFLSNT